MTAPVALAVRTANEASWDDVQAVLGPRGEAAKCQCQRCRLPHRDWWRMPVPERAARLRAETGAGRPDAPRTSGLVGYLDGAPVGWCAVAPRPEFLYLLKSRTPWSGRAEDRADAGVWAVPCFVTRAGFRRRGISRAMARAAEPVAEILARVRAVVAAAAPFDPATSARRFTIGAPDGVSAVFLPRLLAAIAAAAPGIDVSLRQILPSPHEPSLDRAWRAVHGDLDARDLDVAVIPHDSAPARFHRRFLRSETFVVASRAGHAFAADPTLDRYCTARHLVVSQSGDPAGIVDAGLAQAGRTRRVALTVPNFMFALAVLADGDLIAALPRGFVALHAARFGLVATEPPLPLPSFQLTAVMT